MTAPGGPAAAPPVDLGRTVAATPRAWAVVAGTLKDVTTLSLSPSILKVCCGWHGFLPAGVFRPC